MSYASIDIDKGLKLTAFVSPSLCPSFRSCARKARVIPAVTRYLKELNSTNSVWDYFLLSVRVFILYKCMA